MTAYQHLFVDFDGTLVDSVDGIVESLTRCIKATGASVLVDPSKNLIGPPLSSLLDVVLGVDHPMRREIEQMFQTDYDSIGYRSTVPYVGIEKALVAIRELDVHIHVVTNKRRVPLMKIVDMLSWRGYFDSLSTLDSTPHARSKSGVVKQLLDTQVIASNAVLFMGDTSDDEKAARDNRVDFAWASWGYGIRNNLRDTIISLHVPEAIVTHLLKGRR